ncbi:uncharacterized protein [Watersipora subatra]|uniref:uncharacterized protein n=1 Tax=Watersipora subatra TaxID=2589382 RepID=UPI00355AD6AA
MDDERQSHHDRALNGNVTMSNEDMDADNCLDKITQVSRTRYLPIDVYTTINELDTSSTAGDKRHDPELDTINTESTELGTLVSASDLESKIPDLENGTHNNGYQSSEYSSPNVFTVSNNNQCANDVSEVESMFRAMTGTSYNSETEDEKVPSDSNAKIECGRNKVLVTMVLICFSVLGIFVLLYIMTTTDIGRKQEADNSNSTTTSTLPATTYITTTINPKLECMNAFNLSSSWRLAYNDSDIRPGVGKQSIDGYACDLHEELQWFRFTEDAGTHMLDRCPLPRSCGTQQPYWTDATMPSEIMVVSYIKAYGVVNNNCRGRTISMLVIRCSWDTDHDYIYKYTDPYKTECYEAFCGMT